MSSFTKCGSCGQDLRIPSTACGKQGKCPTCGTVFTIPSRESAIPGTSDQILTVSSKPSHRYWLVPTFAFAFLSAMFTPLLSILFGTVMLSLAAASFLPRTRGISQRWLKISHDGLFAKWGRLVSCCAIGVALILTGSAAALNRPERERGKADHADRDAQLNEQRVRLQQIEDEANAKVRWLVRDAEASWKNGKPAEAEKKLSLAEKTESATHLESIDQLRTRMANAEVDALLAEAITAMKRGDDEKGNRILESALAVAHADNTGKLIVIKQQVYDATDSECILSILRGLSDKEIIALKKRGELPNQLQSGYEWLDARTLNILKPHIAGIVKQRKQERRERLEREQAAAEARKKAEEEETARVAAAARKRDKENRVERIRSGFSLWDGSHRGLTRMIKASMHDPDSYEHVSTQYSDHGSYLTVTTRFRGRNAFGALVLNSVTAKVDLDGNVLAILAQEP